MSDTAESESRPRTLRRRLESLFVVVYALYARLLPYHAMRFLGWCAGCWAFLLLRQERRVGYANVEVAFPGKLSHSERRRIVRGSFLNSASVLTRLFWSPNLTADRVQMLVEDDGIGDVLRAAASRKQGLILATAHYGDWEMLCQWGGLMGFPLTIVAEPTTNPYVDDLLEKARGACGNRIVRPRFAVLKLFRTLRDGGRVAVMADMVGRRGRGGVWSRFFGLDVYNGAAMAELSIRTNSPILFVIASPLPGGRMRMKLGATVGPESTGDHAADVLSIDQKVTSLVEELIRRDPAPWLWTHKRWKRRPAPDRGPYPFYSKFLPPSAKSPTDRQDKTSGRSAGND